MYFIGQGVDFHKLVRKNDSIIKLGGASIKTNYKIIAHSDGDVVLHSISNAILGCIQGGDIGEYFGDKDPKNKKLDSSKILKFCLNKIKNYQIVNFDLTIQCENIIFNKNKAMIKKSLCKLLKTTKVNVKATRFERPSNLIGCYCSILIKNKK